MRLEIRLETRLENGIPPNFESAPMTQPTAPAQRPPIPSATIMVVRDGAKGLEVFMLVRNREVDFASGALVFPGGKNDAQDEADAWEKLAPVTAAHPGRAYWVAAIRETFEETGLLLANRASDGAMIDALVARGITDTHQTRVAKGDVLFADLMAQHGLQLASSRLLPFAHWVTPTTMPKRFDTHFFLAAAPEGQTAVHDGGETVESVWIQPHQALDEANAGKRTLVPATALNLEKLASAATVAEAFEHARTSIITTITPTVKKADGGVLVTIPADAGYATTSVFVPRPTPA
jgi:8-oxo-dGTP pyrophosphatase MutT (NUDIX family)